MCAGVHVHVMVPYAELNAAATVLTPDGDTDGGRRLLPLTPHSHTDKLSIMFSSHCVQL